MLASAQERYRTQERLLRATASNHKSQARYHRRETQNAMERLRVLREKMARFRIGFEVIEQK